MKLFIGLDNGVTSGGIAFLGKTSTFEKLPIKKKCRDYTKEVKYITRVNNAVFKQVLSKQIDFHEVGSKDILVGVERPMINLARFKASMSAIRCFESVLIVLEDLFLDYQVVDSKEWQKVLLPKNTEGTDALKFESKKLGIKMFPHLSKFFKKDADSILIAEYLRICENRTL